MRLYNSISTEHWCCCYYFLVCLWKLFLCSALEPYPSPAVHWSEPGKWEGGPPLPSVQVAGHIWKLHFCCNPLLICFLILMNVIFFFLFFLSCTTPEANTDRNTPLSPGVLHFGVFPLVFKATARFVFHINGVISIFPFYCLTLWKPASFFPFQRRRECQGWWRQRSQAPAVLPARLAPPLTWQTGGFYK